MKKSPSRHKPNLAVSIERHAGRVVGLRVTGHAGFGLSGKDIVCSAVSALVLSAANGLKQRAGADVRVLDDADGEYRLDLLRGDARAQAILESVVDGLRAIARSHPGHLKVASLRLRARPPAPRRPSRASQ
ncbi:MAG TPA: ribosomal-processing cysteine protease Prp [Candidatus Tumulicola sp.]|nr:ribosomal-processing cysteine protease Prp [Candidatus Tumulicola sp.]